MAVRFVLTGFGPFGDVQRNPSQELVARLSESPQLRGKLLEARVLEVSVAGVTEALAELGARAERALGDASAPVVAFLHLGVQRSPFFCVESVAVNAMAYALPDARGLQPRGEPVAAGAPAVLTSPAAARLAAALGATDMQRTPSAAAEAAEATTFAPEPGVRVFSSTDAGRYVCNTTYFLSLQQAELISARVTPAGKPPRVHVRAAPPAPAPPPPDAQRPSRATQSFFVHVPPEGSVELDAQERTVLRILEAAERLLTPPEEPAPPRDRADELADRVAEMGFPRDQALAAARAGAATVEEVMGWLLGEADGGSAPAQEEVHKLVIAVRTDLPMGKGKIAAQCCHAATLAYKRALRSTDPARVRWEEQGEPTIVVGVAGVAAFDDLRSRASAAGVPFCAISDAGRTEVASGTRTVVAVGPAPARLVDRVTGHLSLL